MTNSIKKLKERVLPFYSKKSFIHRQWFVQYHLEIMEKLAKEVLSKYKKANQEIVYALVWLHDLGKAINWDKADETNLIEGRKILKKLSFEDDFIEKTIKYIELMDKSTEIDLSKAPLEVRIVSSIDAAAHFIGPFFSLHWYENPNLSVKELVERNYKKLQKDWNKKIVLPYIKRKFKKDYEFYLKNFTT